MIKYLKPSDWLKHCTHVFLKKNSKILDLACGSGRHTIFLLKMGHEITALDSNTNIISQIKHPRLKIMKADLEKDWPIDNMQYDAIMVTNYLNRDIFPKMIDSISIGGFLVYETFSTGNENFGRPKNPNFLLKNRELLKLTKDLKLISYENSNVKQKESYCKQRYIGIKDINE